MNNIFVYVQHLLGIGHLQRTALITSALADNGFTVTVVSGGIPEPLVNFGKVSVIQLPPIKTDPEFTDLFDENGNRITEYFRQNRINVLKKTLSAAPPDMVLLETYPFGRRQMRFELLPLLNAINSMTMPRPVVACSIRDVIQPKSRTSRVQEICDLVDQYYDYIFVHGDERFIRFEYTFPAARAFKEKLVYTGYVTSRIPASDNSYRESNTILVSAGGGAVGKILYRTAIKASRKRAGKKYQWHILAGNNLPESEFIELQNLQGENLVVERNRADFLDLLQRCQISVSQCGYNTMMELFSTDTAAIVVPFEGHSEQEQLIRARAFQKSGRLKLLRERDFTEETLLSEIENNMPGEHQKRRSIRTDGAKWLANYIKQLPFKKQ